MKLADAHIRELIFPHMRDAVEGVSGRGIISYGLTSAGYDLRLGEDVRLFTDAHVSTIDPLDIDPNAFVQLKVHSFTKEWPGVPAPIEYRYVTIPAKGYVLAESVEWMDIPRKYDVVLLGKSTYARCGLIVNCTPLEPAWRGRVTIEIENANSCPTRMYVGMGIAQAQFYELSRIPERDYSNKPHAKYQDQAGLTLPRV